MALGRPPAPAPLVIRHLRDLFREAEVNSDPSTTEALAAADGLDAELLAELRAVGCDHTTNLAQMVGAPLSTVRRHLEAMKNRGIIDGILHDERRIIHNGRRRVYWSVKS